MVLLVAAGLFFQLQKVECVFQFKVKDAVYRDHIAVLLYGVNARYDHVGFVIFQYEDLFGAQILDPVAGVLDDIDLAFRIGKNHVVERGAVLGGNIIFTVCGVVFALCSVHNAVCHHGKVGAGVGIQIDDFFFREVVNGGVFDLLDHFRVLAAEIGRAERSVLGLVQQVALGGEIIGDGAGQGHHNGSAAGVCRRRLHFHRAAGHHLLCIVIGVDGHNKVGCLRRDKLHCGRGIVDLDADDTVGTGKVCAVYGVIHPVQKQPAKTVGCGHGGVGGVHGGLISLLRRLYILCTQQRV